MSEVLPLVGFYLQPAAGGRPLGYRFWREFAETENAVAIKIAPFNRYQTLDVVRAAAQSGREDLALYTGNDDNGKGCSGGEARALRLHPWLNKPAVSRS